MKKIWTAIQPVLAQLLTSKKALATGAAILVGLGEKIGLHLPLEATIAIVGSIGVYVLGQGWADSGKEAAKIAAGK